MGSDKRSTSWPPDDRSTRQATPGGSTITRDELFAQDEWENASFDRLDLSGSDLSNRTFLRCTFDRVRLGEAKLEATVFEDCTLTRCDLTMAKLKGSAFRDVRFRDSKLLGVDWSGVRHLVFVVAFKHCTLTYSSFVGNKMRGTLFIDCNATETSFVDVDLTGAVFTGTDLASAKFIDVVLVDADLSDAVNYAISPQQNKLKRTRFSQEAALALVAELGIVVSPRR